MIDLCYITQTIFIATVQLIELSLQLSSDQRRKQMTLIKLRTLQIDLDICRVLHNLLLEEALVADKKA